MKSSAKKTKKKVAILGATSHIAKGLIENFSKTSEYESYLYARSTEKVSVFLEERGISKNMAIAAFDMFPLAEYDVVINCVGIGRPEKIEEVGFDIFTITEKFDNLVIDYLQKNRKCIYINFSSGAVYGKNFIRPVDQGSISSLNVNSIDISDAYGLAKINSEAKHRALQGYNIVDIRIFSYFSRDIDINSKFLLSEAISSINDNETLLTTEDDIIRDYIHPHDLFQLVAACINKSGTNDVFDAYSKKPVTKFELFDLLARKYNFKYKVKVGVGKDSSTGVKSIYYSKNHKAKTIGYNPKYTSVEAISDESSKMIRTNHE